MLVRRWFRSFEQPEIEDEIFSEDSEEIIDRFSDSELEDITANYKIFADDSAAADENFPALMTRLEPMLKRNGRSIIIPKLAIDKLEEEIKTCADNETEFNISQSLEHIQRKQDEGLIEIHETASNDIDEEFTEILADGNNFMLITQEIGRAELLTSENAYSSAAHIDDKGDLIAW